MWHALAQLIVDLQYSLPYAAALLFFAAYPIVTSIMWITTSMYFLRRWEGGGPPSDSISDAELPWVSVLIPAHNEAEVIADTLEAVCRIDYPHFEVLVIDDGSTDGTARRVEAFPGTAACAWCASCSTKARRWR